MYECKAPEQFGTYYEVTTVFLAGSIEMGKAIDWQKHVKDALKDENVWLFNPRRDDWDASWKQDRNNPQFREQVEWEQNALLASEIHFFYFAPGTYSPISLFELGHSLADHDKELIVCCPEGFWRKGNVDIMCDFHRGIIPLDNFEQAVLHLKSSIKFYDSSSTWNGVRISLR